MRRSRWWLCVSFLILVSAGCGNRDDKPAKGQEGLSKAAPDGASRAFVWLPQLGGLGATVSQPYQVWIQSLRGDKDTQLVFEADKTDGVQLGWNGPTELEICYIAAQITRFRNFFVLAAENSPQIYRVEIVLRKVPKLDDCHP
jgi:hypothetical protein